MGKNPLKKIERKYYKIVGQLLEEYKDRTMGELWEQFDKLKERMRGEIERINED